MYVKLDLLKVAHCQTVFWSTPNCFSVTYLLTCFYHSTVDQTAFWDALVFSISFKCTLSFQDSNNRQFALSGAPLSDSDAPGIGLRGEVHWSVPPCPGSSGSDCSLSVPLPRWTSPSVWSTPTPASEPIGWCRPPAPVASTWRRWCSTCWGRSEPSSRALRWEDWVWSVGQLPASWEREHVFGYVYTREPACLHGRTATCSNAHTPGSAFSPRLFWTAFVLTKTFGNRMK